MTRELSLKSTKDLRDPYHYKDCGLDNIYLVNGYEIEDHDGERHVFIQNIDQLHDTIGRHIILRRKGLTGREIRFLRNTLSKTQNELSRLLGNNVQSVARWEKGHVEIPADAEKLLRVYFFANLSSKDELPALRDFIVEKLPQIDEIDQSQVTTANFILDGRWTEVVREPAYS